MRALWTSWLVVGVSLLGMAPCVGLRREHSWVSCAVAAPGPVATEAQLTAKPATAQTGAVSQGLTAAAAAPGLVSPPARPAAPTGTGRAGVLLEDLSWPEAAKVLDANTVVVIPIGAAAKEHGPHLRLRNDYLLAEHLKRLLLARADVVIAPTVPYHYYPAFVEYPGSTTLRLETARDLLVDICRSLARHGPRRFYALNTGVSTVRALQPAQAELAKDGILLRYTDLLQALAPIEKQVLQQEGGTHADESETSMVLYLEPTAVDPSRAVKDFHPKRPGPFTRDPAGAGTYSPTGIWGDPTLATRHKGERLVNGLVQALLDDLAALRKAELPTGR